MAEGTSTSLKRLSFVQGYASKGATVVESIYKTARGYVPGFAEPYYGQAEDYAANYGAPYLNRALDMSENVLRQVDAQLDSFANGLSGALNYSRDLQAKNMSTFNEAKSQYFGIVETVVNSIKAKIDPTPYVQKAVDTGKVYGDKVVYWADPDKVVDLGFEYYNKAASKVPKVLSTVEPVISFASQWYASAHDIVVANGLYKKVWELSGSTATSVQQFPLVKKAVDTAYPVVAPVADPIASNFSKSKYLKQLHTHLRPVVA